MDVLVVADGHYYITPDGAVYADSVYDYSFYKRYLQAFDHVFAVVRAKHINEEPNGKKLSSGEGVTFLELPAYRGPIEYVKKYFSIVKCVKIYCGKYDCAVFRIPAATSNIFCKYYSRTGKPFAVEVVIDPWENFGPRASGNKLINAVVRRNWTKLVKNMCQKAVGASYVTERYLQKKYPPRALTDSSAFTASYSSVELPDDSFAWPRKWETGQKTFYLSHVSNYFSGYGKGHITLIKAVSIVRSHGYDVRLRFVGDGPKKSEFENYAGELGIGDNVEFTGRLANGSEVRKVIHSSDLFALPTFAEGLPRVLLEAMAEGLPCLSSPVCGIPEILEDEYLYKFDDAEGFAEGIERFIRNPSLMTSEGKRNLDISKQFCSSVLNRRRSQFYRKLRQVAKGG
jgi:glycosyltransferase involved in cell wall biosynthesis